MDVAGVGAGRGEGQQPGAFRGDPRGPPGGQRGEGLDPQGHAAALADDLPGGLP